MTEGGTWSRKENKPSKSEPVFSRRGPDMCLVMQQSPHQPKLGLTEVIKQRRKGGKREERSSPLSDGVIAGAGDIVQHLELQNNCSDLNS